jgi:S1-C subfamily serine protease
MLGREMLPFTTVRAEKMPLAARKSINQVHTDAQYRTPGMCFMRSFLPAIAILTLAEAFAFGQAGDEAKKIYSASQDSVFLVYLNDSSGTPSALGSAFLIAPRLLVTNAHVADAGSPVLAVRPVRIPLKIRRTDEKNNLALLSVDVDLTSRPLPLASEAVSRGEQVFAIGNPEGLEKTISQGIISGLRKRGERDLLQVTSPISHGSSGGPILNAKGEVVGVAVGTLEDGQNLNFAVPVAYVRAILEQRADAANCIEHGWKLERRERRPSK